MSAVENIVRHDPVLAGNTPSASDSMLSKSVVSKIRFQITGLCDRFTKLFKTDNIDTYLLLLHGMVP